MAAMAHVSVRPAAEKPSGRTPTTSRWLIQICWRPAEPGEQRVGGLVELQGGEAILAFLALANLAAEQVRHELLPVTDSQHGLAAGKDGGVHRGAAGVVNAGRAAGDDDAPGKGDCRGRGLTGPDFGVDAEIADFSGDQMTVLPARVQDHDLWSGIQTPMVTKEAFSVSDQLSGRPVWLTADAESS